MSGSASGVLLSSHLPWVFVSMLHFISIFTYFVCGKEEGMYARHACEGLGTGSFTY